MPSPPAFLARFASEYGMLFVLLLLCAYFSFATLGEQELAGERAARALAKELNKVYGDAKPTILVAVKANEEDTLFAQTLQKLLKELGFPPSILAQGDPAEIRAALGELVEQKTSIEAIATTRNFAPSLQAIQKVFPALVDVPVQTPSNYTWPTFLLTSNLLNVANQIVVIAIIAVGMTIVIVTAGIDLSVGSLVALSAVVTAWLIERYGATEASPTAMVFCCVGAILLSGGFGAFSGLMITRFRLPPFIATLAMMQVASGVAFIISQGAPIHDLPDSFVWLGRATFFSVPYAVILMVGIYGAGHIVMSKTTLGRYFYAVGGNREAARLSGVPVRRVLLLAYTISGVMAGLGGVVLASQLKSGAPTYGQMYELYVIAAVVVGGASLAGGEGRIIGTLIGAFIIAVIRNGMNLTDIDSYMQKVVLGFVILGAVLLDMLKKSGGRGGALE